MRCSTCEADNRAGVHFCEECGARLAASCPGCSAPLVEGKRFCGYCGTALEPQGQGNEALSTALDDGEGAEHKPVTVLFCDIVDSTGMTERLGTEAMHRVLDRFFRIATEEVERYGGTVNKFLGDGLLSLVGVPHAHEDHARRAVLVALGLRRRLADDWPRDDLGPPPRIRTGINTGMVLVGTVGSERRADYTAVGDTTNVAARLQAAADPGEILVSDATARLVDGYARLEAVGPLELKGKSSTVTAHRVLGVGARRSPLDGLTPRALTPFVGRDSQLTVLLEMLGPVREGRGHAVGVVAEPGMGKSRLLLEFRRRLAGERVTFLEGRCLSFGTATPYLPLLDILRANCGITADDPPAAIEGKARLAVAEIDMDPEGSLPFLLHLLGVPEGVEALEGLSPEAVRGGTFETLRTMCLQGSRRRPMVLVVEDMHWVDASSEAFLLTLAESLAGAPILLLTAYRPGYRPPWADLSWATQLALRSLGPAESRTVVRAVIGPGAVGTPLEEAILARGEGNPFFLEELAGAVAERGDLGASAEVPDTLQGVLMARIDRLTPEPRRVLQTASVLGREFSPRLLGTIWRGRGELDHHLAQLRRLEFLYERPDVAGPRWVFKHALTQDVAYGSLLSTRRQAVHEAAARALESFAGDRPDEVQELMAFHYSRTERHDKAVEHLSAAAAQNFRRHSHAEAARALDEAVRHAEALPPETRNGSLVEVTLRLADSLYFLGRFTESGQRLERIREPVEASGDPHLRGHYHAAVALVLSHVGSPEDTVRSAEAAIVHAERCADERTAGRAQYILCREAFWRSRLRESVEHGRHGAALLTRAEDRWWEGQCHCFLSLVFCHTGEFDLALETVARGRAVGEAMGDLRLQSYAAWNVGMVEGMRLNTDLAIAECTRALELSPDPLNSAFASGTLGMALFEHGDPAGALDWLERSTATLLTFGVRHTAAWMQAYMAEARFRLGDLEGAREQGLQALASALATGFRWSAGMALRTLGRTTLALGELAEARGRLLEAAEMFAACGARLDLGVTRMDLARCARREGRPEQVAAQLEQTRAAFQHVEAPRWQERLQDLAVELGQASGSVQR